MSAPGHCRPRLGWRRWLPHRQPRSSKTPREAPGFSRGCLYGLAHSNWNDGHCPACDEAEAISQWCRDMAAAGTDADDYCLGTTNGLLAAVQHIARGRR